MESRTPAREDERRLGGLLRDPRHGGVHSLKDQQHPHEHGKWRRVRRSLLWAFNSPRPRQVAASSRLAGSAGTSLASAGADSVVTVTSTMNNVHVVVSDIEGQVVSKCSGGMVGLKHRARANPMSAVEIARKAAEKAVARGFSLAHVRLKGPSRGRSTILQVRGRACCGNRALFRRLPFLPPPPRSPGPRRGRPSHSRHPGRHPLPN